MNVRENETTYMRAEAALGCRRMACPFACYAAGRRAWPKYRRALHQPWTLRSKSVTLSGYRRRKPQTLVDDEYLGLFPPLEGRLASLDTANLPVNVMHARGDSTPGMYCHACKGTVNFARYIQSNGLTPNVGRSHTRTGGDRDHSLILGVLLPQGRYNST